VRNDGVNSWDYLGLLTVTRKDNITIHDVGTPSALMKGADGYVGVFIKGKFKRYKKNDQCCFAAENVDWRIEKHLRPEDQYDQEVDWDMFLKFRNRNWLDQYWNLPPTYRSIDAHESEHVRQYETLISEIESELEEFFASEYCYDTKSERDREYAINTEVFSDWRPFAVKAFDEKYSASKINALNKAEMMAVQKQLEMLELEYEEHLENQD
jgi:hypothetical protein